MLCQEIRLILGLVVIERPKGHEHPRSDFVRRLGRLNDVGIAKQLLQPEGARVQNQQVNKDPQKVLANPNAWNLAVILVADTALIARALMEERILKTDAEYQGYCERVGWHLVPGVF